MRYNREEERERAYQFVMQSLEGTSKRKTPEQIKKQKIQRAISFGKDELDEFESVMNHILDQKFNHLHVYKEVIEEPLRAYLHHIISQSRELLEKNYTKEELAETPPYIRAYIIDMQRKRVSLLKKLAKTYFSNND